VHSASISQSIDAEYSNSLAGGSDYQEIIALNLDVFLTFDNNNRQRSFDVTIINDSSMEDTESFSLELGFDPFALESPSNVILSPNVSVITISDDDDEPTAGIYYDNN
jgi:hypothetical protein